MTADAKESLSSSKLDGIEIKIKIAKEPYELGVFNFARLIICGYLQNCIVFDIVATAPQFRFCKKLGVDGKLP